METACHYLLACSSIHDEPLSARHPDLEEFRVNPLQSAIARFLAWAVSWPITVGILLCLWWLESDRTRLTASVAACIDALGAVARSFRGQRNAVSSLRDRRP